MNKRNYIIIGVVLIVVLLILLGYGMIKGKSGQDELNVTQAYQTVQAKLTQAIAETNQAPPTATIETPQWTATFTAIQTTTTTVQVTVTPAAPTETKPSLCDVAAAGNPIDVTIPDDTVMQPGEVFTKTWRLVNVGTCTWTKNYKLAFFSGDQMSAPAAVNLPVDVSPGTTVDLSVEMTAPLEPGTYQGNWKLKNSADAWFGIGAGGGTAFWVRIVVSEVTETGTPNATDTPTLEATTVTPTVPTPTQTTNTEVPTETTVVPTEPSVTPSPTE